MQKDSKNIAMTSLRFNCKKFNIVSGHIKLVKAAIGEFVCRWAHVWKEPAWVFVSSRLLILLVSFIGLFRFSLHGGIAPWCTLRFGCAWTHYDTLIYVGLAHDGYFNAPNTVFFPLWPLVIRGLGQMLSPFGYNEYYLAALLLENSCFYVVLVLLYYLVSKDFDPSVARTAIFYLAFAPYGIFFFNGYSEALFLLLCLATFIFLSRGGARDWWLAGVCAALASLTRGTGCMLIVPFLVMLVQRFWPYRAVLRSYWRSILNAALAMGMIPLGVATYMIYLAFTKGNPLLFSIQEATFWHRKLSPPWWGIYKATSLLFSQFHDLRLLNVSNLTDLIFTVIPLYAILLGWKHLPLHYSLFALAMIVFSLCYPMNTISSLAAAPRYMLIIFPVFVLLALWAKSCHFDRVCIAVSLAFFTLNSLLFITHVWVA